jgi:hypothetical protein
MSDKTIHVALLDEGTDVWRAVEAELLADGRYKVLGPVPDGELWQFPPGSIVRAELKSLSGGAVLVAADRS